MIDRFLKWLRPDIGLSNEKTRETWLEETLKSLPAGQTILDAGAGTQRYRKFCGHLNYVSQDFGQYDGAGDSRGLQREEFDYGKLDIVSDIVSIPRPDATFDAVMCVEVLEHLPDPVSAIKEFSRLLKKEGKLILTAPFCSLTHFAPYHFSSGFNIYWHQEILGRNGFEIESITPNGNYFEYLAQELNRLPAVARNYTGRRIGMALPLILFLLIKLKSLSKRDTRSSELLCFGYQVLARKV